MKSIHIIGLVVGCTLAGAVSGGAVSYFMQQKDCPAIAAVNVPQIVVASAQVKQLQQEQQLKIQELVQFVKAAQEAVEKEKDATKKAALEQKYTAELNELKKSYEQDYINKLNDISQDMTKVIEAEAQKKGYKIILSKEATVSGVDDITQDMMNKIQ